MALLDLTELMTDADFVDDFTIVRKAQSVSNTGRTVTTSTNEAAIGSVQAASGKTLELFPDLARAQGQIEIWTQSRLHAPAEGSAADEIQWDGRRYTVAAVRDWRNWGPGWNVAIADLRNLLEPEFTE